MFLLTLAAALVTAHATPPEHAIEDPTVTTDSDLENDRILTDRQPPLTIRAPLEECIELPEIPPPAAANATLPWIDPGPQGCIPADINDGVIWDISLDGTRVGAVIVVRETYAWAEANQEYWLFDTLPNEADWDAAPGGIGPGAILATAMEWDDLGMGGPTEALLDDICGWQQSVGATEWEIDRNSYTRTQLQDLGKPPPSATILVPSPARMLEVFQRKSTTYWLWMDAVTNPTTPEVRWYEAKAGWDSGGAFTALSPGQTSNVWDASHSVVPGPQYQVFKETSVSVSPPMTFCQNYLGIL